MIKEASEAVLAERVPAEHGRRLSGKPIICVEPEQDERVACSAVPRAEAAVVVILPPEPVVAPAGTYGCGRHARRLLPARLSGPFAHREGGE
jgi:hypothetical protein